MLHITAVLHLYYFSILVPVELCLNCIVQNFKVHVLIGSSISNPISASFTVSLVKTNFYLHTSSICPSRSQNRRFQFEGCSLCIIVGTFVKMSTREPLSYVSAFRPLQNCRTAIAKFQGYPLFQHVPQQGKHSC